MPTVYIFESFAITAPASGAGPARNETGYIVKDGGKEIRLPLPTGRTHGHMVPRGYEFLELVQLLKGTVIHSSNGLQMAVRLKFRTDPLTGAEESRAYHPASTSDDRLFWLAYRTANGGGSPN